jgi:hexaprenyl-diphosphate synthase
MLHTASLLHDDVIDSSALRRGAPSAPSLFSNKLSVLSGNFVLGRASTALARLGNHEVTQLISSVISNLVEGEILQMKDVVQPEVDDIYVGDDGKGRSDKHQNAWNIYLQKTYLKTASLMAKGARSAVVLGGCVEGEIWKEVAYAYGRNLGIAFQVCCIFSVVAFG